MNKPFLPDRNLEMDQVFMQKAIQEAGEAARKGEVPIGAVIVLNGQIIAKAHNLRETTGDPTAHAEVLAIREAAKVKRHWRLLGATLYTTLEPCPMCAGAMVMARINRLVYGASDPKAGAAGSIMNIVQDLRLNHRLDVTGGVMEQECGFLLKDFFKGKRYHS
jgi:tRNA(adenine34) deaminase